MPGEPSKWLVDNLPQDIIDSGLFKFSFSVPSGKTIQVDLASDIDVDYDRLEYLLEIIPAQYIYWASVYSELRSQISIYEARIARRKAMLVRALRKNAQSTGIRLTDKQLEMLIDADDVDEGTVAHNVSTKLATEGLNGQELQQRIEEEIKLERQKTLPFLESQLIIANKNAGKVYHMVQAIQMRSDHCRSLAGFKRQEHSQSGNLA